MAVIKTKRNFVSAHEPLKRDAYVCVWINGIRGRHLLVTLPIDQYPAALCWAVQVADQITQPIEIVPVTSEEYLTRRRRNVEEVLSDLNDEERWEIREFAVDASLSILHDCDDSALQANSHDDLIALGVVSW